MLVIIVMVTGIGVEMVLSRQIIGAKAPIINYNFNINLMKMKKIILLIFITILGHFNSYAQEPIVLNEVVVTNGINIKFLLKKIKNGLIKNCDTVNYKFNLFQHSNINNDTLLFVNEKIELKIKSFDNSIITKYSDSLQKKIVDIDKKVFNKYIEHSSPLGWISNYPIRKNLNTINLDFIKNFKNYSYKLNKVNENENVLLFYSDSLYNGKIVYNSKTKNPISIEYSNTIPYLFTHTSSQNLRTINNFESSWNYITEKVFIKFHNENGKIYLTNLKIDEEIKDFEYKKFNKKGKLIYTEKNNFSTTIILALKQL